ncbi:MAG TPA: ArgE/DapE family deacylase [Candidatus Acidoferrales bacterium]|nr:ArgE/DapE family deacylase [Candidatus Acidoferrales bacterium]
MPRTLVEHVSSYSEAMLRLTMDLVRIATENPPGNNYGTAIDLLCSALKSLGADEIRVEGHCVLGFVGEGERTLYLSGHYDVVPAQDPSQFQPRVNGKNLFGRGSSDMKSGLAAMLFAAIALRDSGGLRNGRIGLVFVPDEETAGPRGSRYLAKRGILGQHAIGMLTPEPTGGIVWNANRGAITLNVILKGKSAHVGRQYEGINAFDNMLKVAGAVSALKLEVEQRVTGFHISPKAARRSILLMGGQCSSGANFNIVPERCCFTIDRRINPEEDLETEKKRLVAVLEGFKKTSQDLEIEVLQEGHSSSTAEDHPLGRALARSIRSVAGKAPRFEMCGGLLETRFYAEGGIPAYAYGPGLLSVSHGPKEFVPIDRITECARIYALTAAEMFGKQSRRKITR